MWVWTKRRTSSTWGLWAEQHSRAIGLRDWKNVEGLVSAANLCFDLFPRRCICRVFRFVSSSFASHSKLNSKQYFYALRRAYRWLKNLAYVFALNRHHHPSMGPKKHCVFSFYEILINLVIICNHNRDKKVLIIKLLIGT